MNYVTANSRQILFQLRTSESAKMSRICIKNISKNLHEKELKELFSKQGEVTDVKIMRKKDGSSRQFAFVGFRTEQQAENAVKYFNNTFIGLSKIHVEVARKVVTDKGKNGDDTEDKPFLKPQEKLKQLKEELKDLNNRNNKSSKNKDKINEADKSSKQELSKNKALFMEIVKGKKQAGWNDVAVVNQEEPTKSSVAKELVQQGGADEGDSDDDWNDLPLDAEEDGDAQDDNQEDDAEDEEKKPMSDLDYLRSKMKKTVDSDNESEGADNESGGEDGDDDDDEGNGADEGGAQGEGETKDDLEAEDAKVEEEEEDEEEQSRLYVTNLPYSCTEEELREFFSPYGEVSEVHIPIDAQHKRKGFGFVHFLFPEQAERALQEVHGNAFQGRVLHIAFAKKPPTKKDVDEDAYLTGKGGKMSAFQKKKQDELRKLAAHKESWNAAFVRSDAVVNTLAEKLGVEQSAILDTSLRGGDMAVRLAVGEAQVIQENKAYFASYGIDLDALESSNSASRAAKRSTTTLLVKNLPPDARPEELQDMFAKFGALNSFLVPASKTLVVADFVEPSHARAAFKGLAYRRYHNSPLFLEWAPLGLLVKKEPEGDKKDEKTSTANANANTNANTNASSSSSAAANTNTATATNTSTTEAEDREESTSLFIKNLNFTTADERLRDFILQQGHTGLRAVVIQKKQKGSALLSQGYGFAEFATTADAQRAMKSLHGAVLEGHALDVKTSTKKIAPASANAAKKELQAASSGTNKLVVRNVAFQASKGEIRALFAAFGSVKRVRIPKQMNGQHRGFAFVDFSTAQEAANAMACLKNAHLYGRHLIIEWAKDEDDMDIDDNDNNNNNVKGNNKLPSTSEDKLTKLRKRARADEKVVMEQKKKVARRSSVGTGEGGDDNGELGDDML